MSLPWNPLYSLVQLGWSWVPSSPVREESLGIRGTSFQGEEKQGLVTRPGLGAQPEDAAKRTEEHACWSWRIGHATPWQVNRVVLRLPEVVGSIPHKAGPAGCPQMKGHCAQGLQGETSPDGLAERNSWWRTVWGTQVCSHGRIIINLVKGRPCGR